MAETWCETNEECLKNRTLVSCRKYVPDIHASTSNKDRELLDIAKLCVAEGEVGERGETFIIARQENGLSRLLWASFDAVETNGLPRAHTRDPIQ